MKYRLVILLLIWVTLRANSQLHQLDSLFTIAQNAAGTGQVEAYVSLVTLTRNSDPDTAIFFAKKAYAIAEESENAYSKMIAYNAMGSILHVRGSYDLSLKYYRQECVNNVIRHAEATTLDISVAKDHNSISATIEDNGKGFDINDQEKIEGIGLKNILTRINYLKGTVDFDSAPGRGTVVALHIPLPG